MSTDISYCYIGTAFEPLPTDLAEAVAAKRAQIKAQDLPVCQLYNGRLELIDQFLVLFLFYVFVELTACARSLMRKGAGDFMVHLRVASLPAISTRLVQRKDGLRKRLKAHVRQRKLVYCRFTKDKRGSMWT